MIATALKGLTFHLLKNPEKSRKFQDEISALPSADDINLDTLPKLKYLRACLQEWLRMYPPMAIGRARTAPSGSAFIYDK